MKYGMMSFTIIITLTVFYLIGFWLVKRQKRIYDMIDTIQVPKYFINYVAALLINNECVSGKTSKRFPLTTIKDDDTNTWDLYWMNRKLSNNAKILTIEDIDYVNNLDSICNIFYSRIKIQDYEANKTEAELIKIVKEMHNASEHDSEYRAHRHIILSLKFEEIYVNRLRSRINLCNFDSIDMLNQVYGVSLFDLKSMYYYYTNDSGDKNSITYMEGYYQTVYNLVNDIKKSKLPLYEDHLAKRSTLLTKYTERLARLKYLREFSERTEARHASNINHISNILRT